ncbi:MAG: hypothetical protein SOZ52_02730 [Pyramidobacter sp.]|nr:hypothetical protein [Pyramidobacter sp.]
MKRMGSILTVCFMLFAALLPASAEARGNVNWVNGYIEATGEGVVPAEKTGTAQGELLAKRGAMVDLQRNMLEIIQGVQVDGTTVMKDFEATDRVRTEVRGLVKGIQVTDASFKDGIYSVTGRVPIVEVRKVVAPEVCPKPSRPAAQKTGKLTGVVIDVRHLPLVPATTFRVLGENGQVVYSVQQVDYDRFLQSGQCQYHDNINYAKGLGMLGSKVVTVKARRLTNGNVDIVLSNTDAAKLAGYQPFKKSCSVAVVL